MKSSEIAQCGDITNSIIFGADMKSTRTERKVVLWIRTESDWQMSVWTLWASDTAKILVGYGG